MAWTDERVELLKKLWSEGLSASMIAAEFGGISRNSVIGKAARLGLVRRSTASSTPRQRKSPSEGRMIRITRPSTSPRQKPEPLPSGGISLLDIKEGECRWPLNDPRSIHDFRFCGGGTGDGYPYCGYHSRIAYQGARERAA